MTSFSFLVACNGLTAAFPPTFTDYFLHLFILRILCRGTGLLREKFQPAYGRGPFTADKNSKYKHAPIRELAADQPLPQRDLCYLQSGPRSLRPSDSQPRAQRRTFETGQV